MFDVRIFNAFVTAFALATGAVALPVMADTLVYEDDIGRVELTQAPCPIHILEMLKEEVRPQFKGAMYTHAASGIRMTACWFMPPGQTDAVYVHFEDNDRSFLEAAKLKKPSGV